MHTLTELREWSQAFIDHYRAQCEFVNKMFPENYSTYSEMMDKITQFEELIDWLFTTQSTFTSALSYIVCKYFDGEYILSPYDMKTDWMPFNYRVEFIENEDGSFEIQTLKEPHEN